MRGGALAKVADIKSDVYTGWRNKSLLIMRFARHSLLEQEAPVSYPAYNSIISRCLPKVALT